ncbi:uroporphyrinogen-III C-methyltransferase [sulfur-oxidizing endosymbiont of Gigantopelta aegis]|uniref:uroporphyrinogen-III C-methyltransferase n=1 Tax=sulfur-oxidizing endosymbiont of Gigantopelta aegis TaxID=2794934 RepID=UPI0018DDB82F|nr:uroporphyrinogen-III C-methyltransferase [sulfur-oxidizing endosymbiont of Gigantopelta aegis]
MEKNKVNNTAGNRDRGNKSKSQQAKTQVAEEQAEHSQQKNASSMGTAFIFLALIFSLSAGGASFLLFQSMEKNRADLAQQLANTRDQLTAVSIKVDGEVSGQITSLTDKIGRVTSTQQQFQTQVANQQQATSKLSKTLAVSNQQMLQSIDVLFKQKGRERIGWVLSEVEYLLLIANHSLQLQQDVATAIAALEAADSRLLDTGDPGTIESRTKIRDEIQSLKALQQPDVVGMAARLSSVIKANANLPIKYTQVNSKEKIAALKEKQASHDAADLQQAGREFLHELRSLVALRQLGEKPKALMTPKEQFFLQQNLQLKLETARRSLLMGQQDLFIDSTKEAVQWLETFFDLETPQVKQAVAELKALQGMTISSTMPDISGSIKVLRSYQKELEKQQEASR